MAITGISSIDNKQIIAAGALSATSANQALVTSGGDSLQGLYDTVSTNSGSWTGGGSYPRNITADSILVSAEVAPGDSDVAGVEILQDGINFSNPELGYGHIDAATIQNWDSTYETVNANSASWTGGGGSNYTSPSSTIWISGDNIESTDSAYIPSHQEDVLLTAITSYSSINGYTTLDNTNKVFFRAQGNRVSAFDNEGTFLNSAASTPIWAETEYPPIKLYTTTWVSILYSAYSAGITDAYVVELARKNEVNSALNTKLDSSAFTGYYPSNNPSGFAKASDVVMQSGVNLLDGRVVGINNQYLMGCDSAYNRTFVGTSAATGSLTASAYVGTGHQGINIQISARNNGLNYINWTAFSENGSNLSAGQLSFTSTTTNKISGFEINTPLAESISGIKLYGNSTGFTAYSAYTSDIKQLAIQDNITFLSGAVDYVSANVGGGGSVPDEVMSAASAVSANSANWNEISAYQQASGAYLLEVAGDISVDSVSLTGGSKQFETLASITGDSETKGVIISPDGITLRNDIDGNQDVNVTEVAKWNETTDTLSANSGSWGGVTGKQDELTFAYDNVNAISSINNSAIRYPSSAQLLPYPIEFVATTGDATGQNILYVVTGSN